MANLSDQTRAQQVLNYLRIRKAEWVDGPALANEAVGGSEGLRRLREQRDRLAAEGLRVERRKHPDPARDIWQYRLVDADGRTVSTDRPADLPRDAGSARQKTLKFDQLPTRLAFGEAVPCPRCEGRKISIDPIDKKKGPCTRCNGFGLVPVSHD